MNLTNGKIEASIRSPCCFFLLSFGNGIWTYVETDLFTYLGSLSCRTEYPWKMSFILFKQTPFSWFDKRVFHFRSGKRTECWFFLQMAFWFWCIPRVLNGVSVFVYCVCIMRYDKLFTFIVAENRAFEFDSTNRLTRLIRPNRSKQSTWFN